MKTSYYSLFTIIVPINIARTNTGADILHKLVNNYTEYKQVIMSSNS